MTYSPTAFAAYLVGKHADHLRSDDIELADTVESILVDVLTYTHDCGVPAARRILAAMTEPGCDPCGSDSDECADGCRYQDGDGDADPIPPVQSVTDAPAEAVLTVTVAEVSDPLLDLLMQVRAELGSSPADLADMREPSDTQAFMARMDAINRAEFARPNPWCRPAFWVAVITVAAWTVAAVALWVS